MTEIEDRALARSLRRTLPLVDVLARLQARGWSPRRCAAALELPEAYLCKVARVAASHHPPLAEPHVRELAGEMIASPASAAALHALVVESRGLFEVDRWPTPSHVVAAIVRRKLAVTHSPAEWCATTLGVEVDELRLKIVAARHPIVTT